MEMGGRRTVSFLHLLQLVSRDLNRPLWAVKAGWKKKENWWKTDLTRGLHWRNNHLAFEALLLAPPGRRGKWVWSWCRSPPLELRDKMSRMRLLLLDKSNCYVFFFFLSCVRVFALYILIFMCEWILFILSKIPWKIWKIILEK